MSIRLMTLVWDIPFPTSAQMLIALKLADYANDDGAKIYPARSTIAGHARCSESTVKATLKLFREAGLLIVVEEGGKGPHHTTRYKLNVGLINALAAGEVSISGGCDNLTCDWSDDSGKKGSEFDPLAFQGVNSDPLRGQFRPSKGSASYPQSTINHQEPSARESASEQKLSLASRARQSPPDQRVRITDGDACWGAWLSEIDVRGEAGMRAAAVKARELLVDTRWPNSTTPLPIITGFGRRAA